MQVTVPSGNLVKSLIMSMTKYQQRMIFEGRCPQCGVENQAKTRRCPPCHQKHLEDGRARYRRRKKTGTCFLCGNPLDLNGVMCGTCNDSNRVKVRQERKSLLEKVYEGYGAICACCGETNRVFLQIDHVNNDGAQERGGRRSLGATFLRRILREHFPDRYQILCANCNWGKQMNGGTCPHKLGED